MKVIAIAMSLYDNGVIQRYLAWMYKVWSKRLCPRWLSLKERGVIKILDVGCVTKTYWADVTDELSDYTKPGWLGEKNVVILFGLEVLTILWVYAMKLYKARIAWTKKRLVTGQTTGIFLK